MAMDDFTREDRAEERRIARKTRRINLFIIRELVNFIGSQEGLSMQFYYYYLFNELIDDKTNIIRKCEDRYAHMLSDTTKNSLDLIKSKFTECGISDAYFVDRPIKFKNMDNNNLRKDIYSYFKQKEDKKKDDVFEDDEFEDDIDDDYADNNKHILLPDLRKHIADKYDEIMNLDGSPLINSIRILVTNISQSIRDSSFIASNGRSLCFAEILNLAENISEAIPIELYNDKQYKEIYKQLLNSYHENRTLIIEERVSPVSNKNVYTNKSGKIEIQINLMLIRTVFNLLCEMDDLIYPREFYKLIDISRIEYEAMISSGIAENKKLLNKLKQYHFPVSMFRGDKPKFVNVTPAITDIVSDRLANNISEKEYIRKIKEQLFYVNSPANAQFMLSMYSMYQDALHKTL